MLPVPVTVVGHDPAQMGRTAPRWPTSGWTARTAAPAAHHRVRGRGPWLRGAARAMTAVAIKLPPNPIRHFYRGGPAIAELRGIDVGSDHSPEEWIGSASTLFGEASAGSAACRTARSSATRWPPTRRAGSGAEHAARFGAEPRAAGQAARRRRAAARPPPPRRGLRARAPRPGLRQDRGVDRRRGRAGAQVARRLARGRRRGHPARLGREQDHDAMLGALNASP